MHKQVCAQEAVYTIKVHSHSSDRIYECLIVGAGDPSEVVCDCDGYEFRGRCSHQEEAFDQLCIWDSNSSLRQTPAQRRHHICPACGSRTEPMDD